MKKYFEILKKCPLFQGIKDDELSALLGCLGATVERFDKKYTIFSEGNPAKYIGIVLSGSAQVERLDFYGNRSIVSAIEPSEVFAEAFACAEVSAVPVSIIATEPSEIMLIDCYRITHSCAKSCAFHQKLIFNLMKDLAMKNILFHQKVEITSKRTTREKLMAYLMLAAKKAGKAAFDIPFDRQELADYLEVDRSGLSTEIGKLKKEGIINCRKRHFELLG